MFGALGRGLRVMADDQIGYDVLTQEALRSVIRSVLDRVSRTGLPGDHHLYIAFDTQAENVSISKRLKEQYPEEMTIVLQYQFWDLEVTDERFEVKLSFNNVPERLVIPFDAVKAFFDPSVQFGLQFGSQGAANDTSRMSQGVPDIVRQDDEGANMPAAAEPSAEPDEPPSEIAESASGTDGQALAEVVELDAFRKK